MRVVSGSLRREGPAVNSEWQQVRRGDPLALLRDRFGFDPVRLPSQETEAHAVEIQIHYGRCVERQQLADQETAHDGNAKRPA